MTTRPKTRLEENIERLVELSREPCSSCGKGPQWQVIRVGKDVLYVCVECNHRAFRVPFKSNGYARAYMRQINGATTGTRP